MKSLIAFIVVALCAGFVGAQTPAAQPATAETLKKLEAEFMKAAATRGSQGYMSYYAENSVEVPNGADILTGKAAIASTMGFLDDKNNSLTWTPIGADISVAGDLGYTYGTFEFRSKDANGKAVVSRGKYTSIWKRQKDGNWKVVLDMGTPGRSRERSSSRATSGSASGWLQPGCA